MVLNLSVPELKELKPKITVFGVGGAGGNAINNMIESGLSGVEFVAANTDAQALSKSLSDSKMQLGVQVTKGLGAGSHPDIGKSSADETKHEIMERLEGTNMLFITAGMGETFQMWNPTTYEDYKKDKTNSAKNNLASLKWRNQ